AAWGDVDGDGRLDLVVCRPDGVHLYMGDGRGRFSDGTARSGLPALPGAAAVSLGDLEGDGRLDLAVNLPDRAVGARNGIASWDASGRLLVRFGVRKGLVGAVVRVQDAGGKTLGRRDVTGGSGAPARPGLAVPFSLRATSCQVSAALTDGR